MSEVNNRVDWHKIVWFKANIPSHAFILWLARKRRLQTHDRFSARKDSANLVCVFCNSLKESHEHLFFAVL